MNAYEIIEGLKILCPDEETQKREYLDAQHDIIYGPDPNRPLTSEELERLEKELGWHWDKEASSWAHF